MWDLIAVVVPKVKAEWVRLGYSMGFGIEDIRALERDSSLRNSGEKCRRLFEIWLSSGRGCTPKTLGRLLERIKEVEDLNSAAKDIMKELEYKYFSTLPNGEFITLECDI